MSDGARGKLFLFIVIVVTILNCEFVIATISRLFMPYVLNDDGNTISMDVDSAPLKIWLIFLFIEGMNEQENVEFDCMFILYSCVLSCQLV